MARRTSLKRVWEAHMQFLRGLSSEPQSIEGRIISNIAQRGVVARKELHELAEGHPNTLRQVLSILRNSGLVYYREQCRKCYVISMPWVFFVKGLLGEEWRDWLRRRAPDIRDDELGELEEWLKLAEAKDEELKKLGEKKRRLAGRLRRIRLYMESRLESLRLVGSLIRVVPELLPERCSRPPLEALREPANTRVDGEQPRGALIGATLATLKWLLECHDVLVLEYTPFLLRLLAGLAYSYATGYPPQRYATELRLYAKRWRKIACGGIGCHKLYERLVDETFKRLLALLEHPHGARGGIASIKTLLDEYTSEWMSENFSHPKLYNHRSVVARFLMKTLRGFYTWLPHIVEELEASRRVKPGS